MRTQAVGAASNEEKVPNSQDAQQLSTRMLHADAPWATDPDVSPAISVTVRAFNKPTSCISHRLTKTNGNWNLGVVGEIS